MSKYFIVSYTCESKDYCDKEFLQRVKELKKDNPFHIVDNSRSLEYHNKLWDIICENGIKKTKLSHLNVPYEPKKTVFHRRVTKSVSFLREEFLKTDLPYFLILESDVIPPVDLLERFDNDISALDIVKYYGKNVLSEEGEFVKNELKPWGILGGLYYTGFHDYNLKGVQKTHHCLSGCSVYKRELIEKYPFRYDPKDLVPFPDALICHDAGQEYSLWNDHDIICEHREVSPGMRYSKSI